MTDTTAAILANTGTPASPEPDDIEAYLRQFLMDPRIRQMPKPAWKYLLTRHILPVRKFKSSERYKLIWREEGSPLVLDQQALVDKVQDLFDGEGEGRVLVRMAMSYGSPSMEDVLVGLRANGVGQVVLLPLYPQSAYSPTQAVIDSFKRAKAHIGWDVPSVVIDNYHDNPLYINALARAIHEAGFDPDSNDRLLLSMHSIPLKDVKAGDTYLDQTQHTVQLLAERLGCEQRRIDVGFQSVFGHHPEKWAGPLSLDLLAQWAQDGQDSRVFFMCPGFAIDCLETLYDIPYEMCPALEGEGVLPDAATRFVWVRCLGPTDEQARMVKDVLDNHGR